VDRGFDTMLEETYRMNAELTAWPSAQFYDDRLRPVSDVAKRRVVYPRPPMRLAHILDPAEPKVFVDLGHRNATTRCEAEASLTVDLITTLLESAVPADQIGVVAPYRAQSRAIRRLLRQALPDQRELRRTIVIDTVERMQGQERDVVIVSLTTSNPTFATNLADFFFQPERLNVAITRPRSKLIILGSSHVLLAAPIDPDDAAAAELLRDLLTSCARRSVTHH
jgi:DNA replication ATP-dependent helicase Dna2